MFLLRIIDSMVWTAKFKELDDEYLTNNGIIIARVLEKKIAEPSTKIKAGKE
jgi:hypothetical protein